MQHILMLVVGGIAALALFYLGAGLFGRTGAQAAAIFIWVWLVGTILNGAVGVLRAGIPVINEIGAFIPIFGIPAAIAWYLAYRYGVAR